MLYLLSPAKTLDYTTPLPATARRRVTAPLFAPRAAELIGCLRPLGVPEVARLMDLSDELAALNVGRYAAWQPEATPANSRPAVLAFDGDVYDGLRARTLGTAQWDWLQQHLLILSGLYGVLRPFDALQPYRLEMGTTLANPRGKDLYAFWGTLPAETLAARLADEPRPVVVNLASQEYARAVDRRALAAAVPGVRVIDCQFEDRKGDAYKVISFFAKRARGAMVRWAAQHKPRSPKALQGFDADGYAFCAEASAPDRLVFRREAPPALA